jgi:endonuclease YncB( thermonuclease family)
VKTGAIRATLTAFFAALGLLSAPIIAADRQPPAQWTTFHGCTFMADQTRDADSFHVMTADNRQFIFRLYFVDAPESDASVKDRVAEQATYFGVSQEEVLKAGETAKKFTAEWLKRPFSVTTRWQGASGRSRLPRYYGQVEVSGRDLGELLVTYGWARAKGTVAILPGLTRAKDHMEKLERLEAEAKEKGRGLWAKAKRR